MLLPGSCWHTTVGMLANPAPPRNLSVMKVRFPPCPGSGFELLPLGCALIQGLHKRDLNWLVGKIYTDVTWMVSGESHASWNKVRRNAGNLNSFFFFFFLAVLIFYFFPEPNLLKATLLSFPRSVSVHLSLSVRPPTPVSHFYTSAQKHLKYFLHMSGSIWILFCTLIFLYRFWVTVTCSVFFFYILLTSLTGHWLKLTWLSLFIQPAVYLFRNSWDSVTVQRRWACYFLIVCDHVGRACAALFTGACLWVSDLRGKPCGWGVSRVKHRHVSSHSASHTGPPWTHRPGWQKKKKGTPACPRLSPAQGVLIRSLMTQLYKPAWPWKWDMAVA